MIGGILALLYTAAKTGGNFDYMKVVAESQPVVLLVSEIISIAVFGIWYRSKYVNENGKNQEKSRLKRQKYIRTDTKKHTLDIISAGIQIQVTFYVHYRQILLSPLIFCMQNGDAIV